MKDGFYWARLKRTRCVYVVQVLTHGEFGQFVFPGRKGRTVTLREFVEDTNFIAKEPLTTPEIP